MATNFCSEMSRCAQVRKRHCMTMQNGILGAITAGANTVLVPYADFKKFDVGFVVLNTMRAQYLTNPQVSLCDLGNAVAYGEAIIHRGD